MTTWDAPQPTDLSDIGSLMAFGRWHADRVRQISDLAAKGGAHLRASHSLERKLHRIVVDLAVKLTGTEGIWWSVTDRWILTELARQARQQLTGRSV